MAKPARKPDPIVAAHKAKERKPRRQAAAKPPEPIGPPPEPFDDPFPDPFRDAFAAPLRQAAPHDPAPPAPPDAAPERREPAAAQPAPCRRLSRPIAPRVSRNFKKDVRLLARELLFMGVLPGVLSALVAVGWSLRHPQPQQYLADGRPDCVRLTRSSDQCFYVPEGNLTLEQLAAMSGLAPQTLRRLNPNYPRDPAVKIDWSILEQPK